MKPESLLESDPVNTYLNTKPQMPFRIPEEVPNGNYGLIINGYSLVGSAELQLYSLLPRNFFPRSSLLQGNFKTPSLFHQSPFPPFFWCSFPTDIFPYLSLGRNNEEREAMFLPYPNSSLLMWLIS